MKTSLDDYQRFINEFYGASDLITREIVTENVNGKLVFIDGLADSQQLDLSIIRPLTEYRGNAATDCDGLKGIVTASCALKAQSFDEAVQSVSSGDAAFFSGACEEIIVFSVRKGSVRAITEPPTGQVIKGPREGFVEDLKTNTVLIRRRLRTNKLIVESLTFGRFTETAIAICYIKGIAKSSVVEKIKSRIKAVDAEGLTDSSAVTKILEERPYSLFKQTGNTEKPDVVVSKLLDGRVAILTDGSPIAVTLPFLLIEDFTDTADRYKRNARSAFIHLMRLFAVFFAVLLPAVYVAVQMHQYQMLPLQLLTTLLASTTGIPFTPAIEMLISLILFEIVGEASVRMPKHVGMALSVVGAIVLGETAVQAGILSSVTVLIVAMSGIGLYTVPDEVGVLSVLRMLLVVMAGLFGLVGIICGLMVILAYLNCLENFGVPYLSPLAPIENEQLRNLLITANFTDKTQRTQALDLQNKTRITDTLPRKQ